MPRPTLYLAILISFFGTVAKASDEVTLIFKRPYFGLDLYEAKIEVNGIKACVLDSGTVEKITTCEIKISSGEINIKTSSSRGNDYNYVIDVEKNKTYTIVVYKKNDQPWDLLWSTLSESLIRNKISELSRYNNFSYKTQVISIK